MGGRRRMVRRYAAAMTVMDSDAARAGDRPCRRGRDAPTAAGRAPAGDDGAALYRLLTWASPGYPVGAFSYSSGLEWAVEAGDLRDAVSLRRWLAVLLAQGSLWSDAVIFAQAHAAAAAQDDAALGAVAELAAALVPSRERHLETTAMGQAFVETTRAAWPCPALDRLAAAWPGPTAYPVAVAVACAGHAIALPDALCAFLQGAVANLVSAGVRLIPLGQTEGQRLQASLAEDVSATVRRAAAAPLTAAASAAFRADIAGMRHETQYTRLFRS
jgi:urease accessory protein